jgi:hypothetical protein
MIAKIVVLFLVFIGVMGMFGKMRMPGAKRLDSRRCQKCGKFRLGRGPCDCSKG